MMRFFKNTGLFRILMDSAVISISNEGSQELMRATALKCWNSKIFGICGENYNSEVFRYMNFCNVLMNFFEV